jgi:energy-converting hydrogenase Eha subunit A
MDTRVDHSTALYHFGIRGAIAGAVIGALLAVLLSWLLDLVMRSGSGGPGLHFLAGAAVGALAGWFWAILRHRHTGRGAER